MHHPCEATITVRHNYLFPDRTYAIVDFVVQFKNVDKYCNQPHRVYILRSVIVVTEYHIIR